MKFWKRYGVDVLLLNCVKVANAYAIARKSLALCSVVAAMVMIAATHLENITRIIVIVKMMMKKYDEPHDPPHHHMIHHTTT